VIATARLEDVLSAVLNEAVTVVARRRGRYASTSDLEEVDALVGGRGLALVLKDTGEGGLLPAVRPAKPDFVRDTDRELDVYTTILRRCVPDAPRLYASLHDPPAGRCLLVLERVAGQPLHEVGELEPWLDTARWLARFHRDCGPARARRLLVYDRELYETWIARAAAFNTREDIAWLQSFYPEIADFLCGRPTVFLHGTFYAANVLLQQEEEVTRVRPVGWEMAAIGPALLDLAALTAGRWRDEERDELDAAYWNEAVGSGRPDWLFREALECCRLHLAVQCLGWARDRTPPPAHAQFWLGEAARAAERLGL